VSAAPSVASREGTGSLRSRLVDATLAVLGEGGPAGVTLRGVARRAGVSHTAPLKHFSSFAELLTETAAIGFEILGERVDTTGAALPPGAGSRARLMAASRAYVETALEHPALFRLMFRFDIIDRAYPRYEDASTAAYRRYLRYVQAVQDDGFHADIETEVLNATIWSVVHGIATLWSDGPLAASVRDLATLDEIVTRSLDMILGQHPSPVRNTWASAP
jgi:AcrR family transcriptional regulator